jgi:hypothetical protein
MHVNIMKDWPVFRYSILALTLLQAVAGIAAAAPPQTGEPSAPEAAVTPGRTGQTIGQAGHLANVQGKVLLNRGQGFQPVTGDVDVLPGDRVRAVDGSAEIVYSNGTTVLVQSGQMVVVLSVPPPGAGWLGEVPTPVLIGGGATLVGIGVGVVVLDSHSSKSNPASP